MRTLLKSSVSRSPRVGDARPDAGSLISPEMTPPLSAPKFRVPRASDRRPSRCDSAAFSTGRTRRVRSTRVSMRARTLRRVRECEVVPRTSFRLPRRVRDFPTVQLALSLIEPTAKYRPPSECYLDLARHFRHAPWSPRGPDPRPTTLRRSLTSPMTLSSAYSRCCVRMSSAPAFERARHGDA